jgi:hypothetical protein
MFSEPIDDLFEHLDKKPDKPPDPKQEKTLRRTANEETESILNMLGEAIRRIEETKKPK